MIGLEKVTDRIIADAKDDAAKLMSAAEEKKKGLDSACDEKIRLMLEEKKADTQTEAGNILSRANSDSETLNRNIILEAKGKALDETFAACEKYICSLPTVEYAAFVVKNCRKAIEAGDSHSDCILTFNGEDKNKISGHVLAALGELFPGRKFSLSDKTAPIGGGALLDFGETDVDCSVKAVLDEYRPELEGPLCQLLFESTKAK